MASYHFGSRWWQGFLRPTHPLLAPWGWYCMGFVTVFVFDSLDVSFCTLGSRFCMGFVTDFVFLKSFSACSDLALAEGLPSRHWLLVHWNRYCMLTCRLARDFGVAHGKSHDSEWKWRLGSPEPRYFVTVFAMLRNLEKLLRPSSFASLTLSLSSKGGGRAAIWQ